MKRVWLRTLLVVSLLLAGCSRLNDFVIVNRSEKSLELSIQYRRAEIAELATSPIESYDNGENEWRVLTKKNFQLEGGTVTLDLPPQTALRVAQAINYTGHDSETFDIVKLTFEAGGQTKDYEGKQVQTLFRKRAGDNYAFVYK